MIKRPIRFYNSSIKGNPGNERKKFVGLYHSKHEGGGRRSKDHVRLPS